MSERLQKLLARLELDQFEERDNVPDEVEALLRAPGLDAEELNDLEELPFVTIDNADSRDLDQALYVRAEHSGWRVFYALADASYYIRPGTELFERAVERGSTYYMPGLALPMLPAELSEGLISLNPGVPRRAVVFETSIADDGEISSTSVYRGRIRSRAKLTYDGVQLYFDGRQGEVGGREWEPSIQAFAAVGERLRERAHLRGMIEFERHEAEVEAVDGTGRFEIRARQRNDVERWNEQISLLCNTEGARLLTDLHALSDDLQAVYRVHLPPLRRRLRELEATIADIVERHQLPDTWKWDGQAPLAHYLAALPDEPHHIRRAIDRQVRYANRSSMFSEAAGPHFALAVEQYARFSSPMREVVGIFTHKELLEALGMDVATWAHDDTLRERVITAANASKQKQKELEKEVLLLALDDYFDEELSNPRRHHGVVIGVRSTRLYVALEDVPVDLKVYVEDLEDRFGTAFSLHESSLEPDTGTSPGFGIGDAVTLTVDHRDADQRRWHFVVGHRS